MLQDHMPDKVLAALKKVISDAADDNTSMNSSYNLNPRIQRHEQIMLARECEFKNL